jgi:type IV pilus assembly protein PilM
MRISNSKKKDERSLVGLDINASSIAAVEVRTNGSIEVVGHGSAPLAPGVFREGEAADAEALGAALKELFSTRKLSSNVRLGIANQRVAVRTVHLPPIPDPTELAAAIRFQAQEHIPMPIDSVVLDWEVVGHVTGPTGDRQIEVVVVAARREMIRTMVEAMDAAGLKPAGIDLSAFGMVRALSGGRDNGDANPYAPGEHGEPGADGPDAEAPKPATLYCNLDDVTNLAVAQGSACLFTRVSPFGIEGIAEKLAERSHLTLEHARMWLTHVGLAAPVESVEGDPAIVQSAREVLTAAADKLVDELRLSLSYYSSQEQSAEVTNVVVCGPGTAIPGLPEAMQASVGYPFEIGRPAALGDLDDASAARLTVSYGLALDE